MKTINILGSCVSRDAFGMFENDGGFDIQKCVTNSGIFSLCSQKLSDISLCSEENFSNSRHYYQRCAALDINKDVFAYLNEADSDYVVIDLGNLFSKKVMKIKLKNDPNPDNFTYITKTQAFEENPDFLKNAPFEVLETFQSDDDEFTMMAFIYQYAEVLKEHFDQKKIIILELKLMERYIDSEGSIKLFNQSNHIVRRNNYLNASYSVLRQMLPEAHFIRFPDVEIFCNMNHKWGINVFHYINEYYSYVMDSIRAIVYAGDRQGEKIMLKSIRHLYNSLLRERYASTVNGEYTLKNDSFISSKAVRYGDSITVCLNASGGTGDYTFDIFVRKKSDKVWQSVGTAVSGTVQYEPKYFAVYEICVKVKDTNHVVKKEYFEFVVH